MILNQSLSTISVLLHFMWSNNWSLSLLYEYSKTFTHCAKDLALHVRVLVVIVAYFEMNNKIEYSRFT